MQPDQVKQLLQQQLSDCDVEVASDGSHFNITVIGDIFEGLNAVKKQQLIYAVLNPKIADGSIHAVNMQTFTRAQWQQKG